MSGEDRRPRTPEDPPWSLDLLADLHAGAFDAATDGELRPKALADPEARAVLDALDATLADLDGLPSDPIPGEVAGRIEAALQQESAARQADGRTGAEVVDLAAARKRRRRVGWAAGLLTAAAAVIGVVVVTNPGPGGPPRAVGPSASSDASGTAGQLPPLALRDGELPPGKLSEVLGSAQYGALSEPARLVGCLQANGVTSGNPLGARSVTVNGEPAQLLVLPTGDVGRFRLLVVRPDCGPGNPATISDTTFGG